MMEAYVEMARMILPEAIQFVISLIDDGQM